MPVLPPLELPSLNQNSNASAFSVAEIAMLNMDRIERLGAVIVRMLRYDLLPSPNWLYLRLCRTPAERPVPVPVGVLLQLVYKLLALDAHHSVSFSHLFRVNSQFCLACALERQKCQNGRNIKHTSTTSSRCQHCSSAINMVFQSKRIDMIYLIFFIFSPVFQQT